MGSAMNRKLVVGLLALAVVGVAAWLLLRRGREAAKPVEERPRVAAIKPAPSAASGARAPEAPGPAPRGAAPRWSLDADVEGPLRLEGQVVDADGKGVGGATVVLGSVPPRTAKAEDDGAFSFD